MAGPELLTAERIADGMADLPAWQRQDGSLRRTYRAAGFPAAVRVVDEVVADCQELDHHPDIDIRYDTVHFTLTTHSAGGVTAADLALAHRIEAAAGRVVGG